MTNVHFLFVAFLMMSCPSLALHPDPQKENLEDNLIVDIKADSSRKFVIIPLEDDHAITVLNYSDLDLRFIYNGKMNLPDSEGMGLSWRYLRGSTPR